MKRLVALWILGASLTACSTAPKPAPNCDVPAPMAQVGHALSVPEMPAAVSQTAESATFDLDGLLQLDRVRKAGEANQKIAQENSFAIDARNSEINALIECTYNMNLWIEFHAEDLADEKRAHFLDNWFYRGMIALGLIAVAI